MKYILYDKYLHFVAGFIVTVWVSAVTEYPLIGFVAALFVGVMKEVRDWCCYQGFYQKDMLATWAGGAVGYALMAFVQLFE